MKRRLTIPGKFELGSQTVLVNRNNRLKYVLGFCDSNNSQIVFKGVGKRDAIDHTFVHEVVHMILFSMGEKNLARNEKFVDTFADRLLQVYQSASGTPAATTRDVECD